MRAGLLRQRVKTEQSTPVEDRSGQMIDDWSEFPTGTDGLRWASVVPSGGSEQSVGGAMEFVATFTVTTRYRKGFTSGMRFIYNGRALHIDSIENTDERNEELIFECREVRL